MQSAEMPRSQVCRRCVAAAAWTAGLVVLGFVVLQMWRPKFFTTDDNLGLILPVWMEIGRDLFGPGKVTVSEYLFGGAYPLRADPVMSPLWTPLALGISLLSPLGLGCWMWEVHCLINLLLAGTGMCVLARQWGDGGSARGGAWLPVWLGVSYAFTMYNLVVGSSWPFYLSNVAALPWMVLGLRMRGGWAAWACCTLALYHNAVDGYQSLCLYGTVLVSVYALALAWERRDAGVLWRWLAAGVVAGLLALPTHWPVVAQFGESSRSLPIDPAVASEMNMPPWILAASFVAGPLSHLLGGLEMFGYRVHAYAMASALAAPVCVLALAGKRRWRLSEGVLLGLLGLVVLWVWRPAPLAELLHRVPVLNAFRWPVKDVCLALFIMHLWPTVNPDFSRRYLVHLSLFGVAMYALPLVMSPPPTFHAHEESRRELFSGRAERYWREIGSVTDPGLPIVPVLPEAVLQDLPAYLRVPAVLTGSGNFPAGLGVLSWSGYSTTPPKEYLLREPRPASVYGDYSDRDLERILQLRGVRVMRVVRVDPLAVEITETGTDGERKRLWAGFHDGGWSIRNAGEAGNNEGLPVPREAVQTVVP